MNLTPLEFSINSRKSKKLNFQTACKRSYFQIFLSSKRRHSKPTEKRDERGGGKFPNHIKKESIQKHERKRQRRWWRGANTRENENIY